MNNSELLAGLNRGWQFIPLSGKRPIPKKWQLGASSEQERTENSLAVQQHFDNGGNVGLVCGKPSGVIVIDIDTHSGAVMTPDDFPRTWTAITGKGGRHLYFKRPDIEFIGNAVKGVFHGGFVDIRGDGGQVVFVGCVHPETGQTYTWAPGMSPSDLPLAEFPSSTLEAIKAKDTPPPVQRGEYAPWQGTGIHPWVAAMLRNIAGKLASTTEGRNNALNSAALILGHYCPQYLSESDIESALMDAMQANGYIASDGIYSTRATIASGLEAGMREPQHPPAPRQREIVPCEVQEYDYNVIAEAESKRQETALTRSDASPRNEKIDLPGTRPEILANAVLETRKKFRHARYRGEWHVFDGGSYLPVSTEWMAAHCRRVLEKCRAPEIKKGEETGNIIPVCVKNQTIAECLGSLIARDGVMLGDIQDAPMWRGAVDHAHRPADCFPMANGCYDVARFEFLGPRPDLFVVGHADYAFDPMASDPVEWKKFLNEILGHDPKAILCLQEWFGYQLQSTVPHHKALYIWGPKRAGKGTIASVLSALVGAKATTAPTLDQLAENFGMQPLIGRRVAIVGDARFVGKNVATTTERLLGIIANDQQSVARKNKENWSGRLNIKFTIMSNDLPKLRDDSATIMSRFIFLELKKSFYGSEDLKLVERLLSEMPGIFAWSLEGLERLRHQGRFTEPENHQETAEEMEASAAPVKAFISECCIVEENAREGAKFLYKKYREWCLEGGSHPLSSEYFGRQMASCGFKARRHRDEGDRLYSHFGVRFATEMDAV